MKTLSKALLLLALMAATTPAFSGEVTLSFKDMIQKLGAEAKAMKARHQGGSAATPTAAVQSASLPDWIGLSSEKLDNKGYGTIVGCASAEPNYDVDPDGMCTFQVGLYVNEQTQVNLAVVLAKTPLKQRPQRMELDDLVDYGYVTTDAVAAPNDPHYYFSAQNCKLDGRPDPTVFGFRYDKRLDANAKDPQRIAREGEMLKAWKGDPATGKILTLDATHVQCASGLE